MRLTSWQIFRTWSSFNLRTFPVLGKRCQGFITTVALGTPCTPSTLELLKTSWHHVWAFGTGKRFWREQTCRNNLDGYRQSKRSIAKLQVWRFRTFTPSNTGLDKQSEYPELGSCFKAATIKVTLWFFAKFSSEIATLHPEDWGLENYQIVLQHVGTNHTHTNETNNYGTNKPIKQNPLPNVPSPRTIWFKWFQCAYGLFKKHWKSGTSMILSFHLGMVRWENCTA